MYIPVCNNSMA